MTKAEIDKDRVSLVNYLAQGLSVEELAQYFHMTAYKMSKYLSKNSLSARSLGRELTNQEVLATSYRMQEQMWHLRSTGWSNSEVLELLGAPDWVLRCEELV